MHLVHVRLRAVRPRHLPPYACAQLLALARPGDALEHVSPSSALDKNPTLGLFFSCPSLEEAERAALRLALQALRSPAFAGYAVMSCGAALIPLLSLLPDEPPIN